MMFWKKKAKSAEQYVPPLVPTDEEILKSAPIKIHRCQNVARGTWGYSVLRLAHQGKLTPRFERGVLPDEDVWIYERTQ